MTGEVSAAPLALPHLTIAIIGAGPAGRSFALDCLTAGLTVILEDVMPSKLRRAETELSSISGGGVDLHLVTTVEDAVRLADLAIDFVPDELESKLEIFSLLDRMAPPRTVLCTPTEALSITDLASCVYRPDRCVALRGLPMHGSVASSTDLRLVHSPAASPQTIALVTGIFLRLGVELSTHLDAEAPMLVKNQRV